MGKTRIPISTRRKKRRLNNYLKQFNEGRRKKEVEPEPALPSISNSPRAEIKLQGRRIVAINELFAQLKQLGNHGPLGCTFENMVLVNEKRVGLKCCFVFQCNFCKIEKSVWSEKIDCNKMDINTCAVSGTMTTGGGHSQLEEMLSTMDIPPLSDKTFRKYEVKITEGWMDAAADEMKKAAEEEARHAVEVGDVDKDGTPLITVVADGSWGKRSYRTNYSSLSGVAAIVGHHTRKVLYMGVKNKYCTPCARAHNTGQEPKPHTCYKNWGSNQSSSSMEPALIADGFTCSEAIYGLRYARLIADGDSSVYKKILERRPYKWTTVEKIECKNHLMRNFCNRLRQIATTSNRNKNTVFLRKKIGENILRCRTAVTKAAEHRRNEDTPLPEKINKLRLDILNIPSHVFGEHKDCKERGYFCDLEAQETSSTSNLVPGLVSAALYSAVTEVVRDLSRHSRSLITDVTSNSVEHYNSIVAKYIGGKRINFALRGSYQARCTAAVLQYNTGNAHYVLHKKMYHSSPGTFSKSTGIKRKKKVERQQGKKSKKSLFSSPNPRDQDYGPAAQRPDLEDTIMAQETAEFLAKQKLTEEDISRIERETVDQRESGVWLETRRTLLTASNFGRVCKMLPTTGCESVVRTMLYSSFDCEAMAYGRKNEAIAKNQIQDAIGKSIKPCGLYIDFEKPFLGATPDGLIDEDGIIEIKCPSSARTITPEEAIKTKKIKFWKVNANGNTEINKKHEYYYQIQGQLHVTRRNYCLFSVWTPKGLKIERVERDDDFWNSCMVEKLETFYLNCVLPEIIDPRHRRSMPIRNPAYILKARENSKVKSNTTKSAAGKN